MTLDQILRTASDNDKIYRDGETGYCWVDARNLDTIFAEWDDRDGDPSIEYLGRAVDICAQQADH